MPVPDSMLPTPARPTPSELRALVAGAMPAADFDAMPFGVPPLDGALAGGGLRRDALHEVSAGAATLADDAASTLFVAGVAARFAASCSGAPVLWALTRFDLYAPGLEQAGLGASAVIHAEARDDAEVLALLEDAVRDGSPSAVVGEVRRAGMVATRRLQLAAGDRRVPVLLHRRWRRSGSDPLDEPSAAVTRWRVACAPSGRSSIGVPRARWAVDLVRQRGGAPLSLLLEACDHEGRLAVPTPVADRAAPAAGAVLVQAA